jgi:hypothetical protein
MTSTTVVQRLTGGADIAIVFRFVSETLGREKDLATKYPRHFADLVNENTDAITADVLLQCCLFGELIYE